MVHNGRGLVCRRRVGVELLSGQYWYLYGTPETMSFSLLVMLEEGLEMGGVAILVYALCSYLNAHIKDIHVVIDDTKRSVK
jgi:hypothetical protein